MIDLIERIKKRIEKERAYDETACETLADKGNRVHQVLHSSRNSVYNIILEVIDEELAKEPPEEPNIPIQCVDGSCPMALSDEYEERGMDVIHSCEECQYNNKEPLKCNSDLISRAKLIDNLGLKHGSSPLIALTSKMVLDTINNQPQVQPIVKSLDEVAEEVQDIVDFEYSVHGGFDKDIFKEWLLKQLQS